MEEQEELSATDDYYAWLGLDKSASKDDINNAFRKMSRMYHPDKHITQENKAKAELLFNKIKRAHEVLIDPHLRAIYDTTGIQGLNTEGWQMVSRTKTPQEILEEFEKLKLENEEKMLQKKTNPKGSITIGFDATDIFERYDALIDDRVLPSIDVDEISMRQSVDCPLTASDTATVRISLSSHNGKGQGGAGLTFRRILGIMSWAEAELSLGTSSLISLRYFRTLWNKGFGTVSTNLQVAPDGTLRPAYSLTLGHQLDKHLQGRMTWSLGFRPSVNSMLAYDKDKNHLSLGFQLGVESMFVFTNYSRSITRIDTKIKTSLRFGTFGLIFEYGCDKKITQFSNLGATLSIHTAAGISLRIRVNRGSQTFSFPIRLSENMNVGAIFYGTVAPLLVFYAVKKLLVEPYFQNEKSKQIEKKKEENLHLLEQKKREALAALEIMSDSVDRIIEIETAKSGLVIQMAFYGRFDADTRKEKKIEVTRQLQSLVKDSILNISEEVNLNELPGFYDPCFGEAKSLSVEYEFKNKRHSFTFQEKSRIILPNPEHIIN